jgi:hypothetical protein
VSLALGSGHATSVTGKDSVVDLAPNWNTTEWGVYGDGGGSAANFGSNSTLEAQTALTATSSGAPDNGLQADQRHKRYRELRRRFLTLLYNTELLRGAGTLLLSGRTSFMGNKDFWVSYPDTPGGTAIRRGFAELMRVTEKYVRGSVSRMLVKLGCANRTQAGLLAHDAGIVRQ